MNTLEEDRARWIVNRTSRSSFPPITGRRRFETRWRHWRGRQHHRRPSVLRLLLRVGKRGLVFWPDLLRLGPAVAWVKLCGGWLQCWGQWLERRRQNRQD